MIVPFVNHVADGLNDTFPVPFPYLHRSHVVVKVNDVVQPSTNYTWMTANSIKLNALPPDDQIVRFERVTPTEPLVTYTPSAALTIEDLQTDALQALYRLEEMEAEVDRALKLGPNITGVSTQLPTPIPFGVLSWDSTGTQIVNGNPNLSGDLLLRGELAQTGASKGSDLVFHKTPDTNSLAWALKGILDGFPGKCVLGWIPVAQHAAIRAKTSTFDCTSYIQNAINDIGATGGGLIYFPPGLYNISAKLDIPFDGVVLVGAGCGHYTGDGIEVTRNTAASRIAWIGSTPAAGVPMVEFRTPSTGRRYGRGGLRDIMIDGKMVARIGLALTSYCCGEFRNVHVYAVTDDCYLFRQADYNLVGGAGATQFNQFYNCAATTYGGSGLYLTNSANGFRFTGPKWGTGGANAVQTGDASCNALYSPQCNLATGTSIIFEGVGQNQVFSLQCASWNTTAPDVIFGSTDQDTNWPPSGGVTHAKASAARYNAIYWAECQIRAKASQNTNGQPSFGNLVVGLSHGNAAPVPTLEPPGAGTLHPEIVYQSMGNFTGDASRSALGGFVEVVAQDNTATINPALFLKKSSDVGANGDGLGKIQWRMTNAAGTKDIDAGRINGTITTATAGAETVRMAITPMYNGSETDVAMAWQNGVIVQDVAGPTLSFQGFGTVNVNGSYWVDNVKVVGNRSTGWGAPTGTATRTTFATGTVTTAQLAERVKALIDDLTAHGLIGA